MRQCVFIDNAVKMILKCYLSQHDDREMPRRQKSDRSRGRSRSPLWVHDRFDDQEGEEDQVTKSQDISLNFI